MTEQYVGTNNQAEQSRQTLSELGVRSLVELSERARATKSGGIYPAQEVKEIIPERDHLLLKGIDQVLVDAAGTIVYQASKTEI